MYDTGFEKLVTVAVPTYNDSKYLERCLKSICMQNYRKIEILVLDDGSNEDEREAIEQIIESICDERIHLLVCPHRGAGAARNVAISKANGEYLCFVDADDMVSDAYVMDMVTEAEKHGLDLVVCARSTYYHGSLYAHNGGDAGYLAEQDRVIRNVMDIKDNFHIAVCKLYRVNFLRSNQLCFSPEVLYEDMIFSFKTAFHITRAAYIPSRNYFYMARDNSRSMTMFEGVYSDYCKALSEVYLEAIQTDILPQMQSEFYVFALESLNYINSWLQQDENGQFLKAYKEAAKWIGKTIHDLRKSKDIRSDLLQICMQQQNDPFHT